MVTAFVVIPVLLALALVWGTAIAWRRSGAPRATTIRVAIGVGAGSAVWMTATWLVAPEGHLLIFRR